MLRSLVPSNILGGIVYFQRFSAILVLSFAAGASAFAGNIVQNPGFETGDFTSWVVNRFTVSSSAGGVNPNSGNFFANSGCVGTGCISTHEDEDASWIYQDLATTPGSTYTLTFFFAPGSLGDGEGGLQFASIRPFDLTGIELQVLWGDSATPLVASAPGTCDTAATNCVFDTTDTTNGTNYGMIQVLNLMATSTSMRLQFLGEQDPAQLGLDDISVTPDDAAAPEPAAFALMGSGLAALGYLARRNVRR